MLDKYHVQDGMFHTGEYAAILLHPRTMEKIASERYTPSRIIECMNNLRPRDDGRYVLLIALGAGEYYGNNRNTDFFPEWSLRGDPPPPQVMDLVRRHGLPVPPEYGYTTFERYAYPYRGHCNFDPIHSIGERVCCAAYNDKMHRVELIIFIFTHKAPDVIEALDSGKPVAFSMGAKLPFDHCLFLGTQVYGPDMVKNAEDVEVGDLVFTHLGRARKVTRLFRRTYAGPVVTLKIKGLVQRHTITANHHVRVFRQDQLRQPGGRRLDERARDAVSEFVEIGKIRPGDYVAVPRIALDTQEYESVDVPLARLCGYYLGDGHIQTQRRGGGKTGGRDYVGVSICCNSSEEEHIRSVVDTLEVLSESKVHVYPAGEDRNAVQVVCMDQVLAARLAGMCGRLKAKHLPAEIFYSPNESRLALLGGMLDTDGSVDRKKKSARITITNSALMEQTQILALSVGIPATLSRHRQPHGFGGGPGASVVSQLYLGCAAVKHLAGYSVKCSSVVPAARWSATAVERDDAFLFPVESVLHEEVIDKPVFNFSVEEDETYHVGFSVHNCSACGNVARRREEYCECLKTKGGQILPDGRRVFAYNYFPRFFDISEIVVPADRIAYSLKKVAGVGGWSETETGLAVPAVSGMDKFAGLLGFLSSGGKTATLDKEIPADDVEVSDLGPSPIDPDTWRIVRSLVEKDEVVSPRLPIRDLQRHPLVEVLSLLTALGIVMRPEEVDSLSGGDPGKIPLALDLERPDLNILSDMAGVVQRRSLFEPAFSVRAGKDNGSHVMAVVLRARKSPAFEKYRGVLRNGLDVDKLRRAAARASLRKITKPDALEREMIGLDRADDVPLKAILPFLAAAHGRDE